ncbi:MAG: peptidoglycan-binding protein [Candidatus Omnitrophica bacterium]|nr:peptidoglycan-binding protein [Candidatus Omnitrophota bacterium]
MKTIIRMAMLGLAGVSLAGCATTSQSARLENEQLRTQVAGLQSQVAALDSQVDELRTRQQSLENRSWEQGTRLSSIPSLESRGGGRKGHAVLTAKEIQLALQRAGYYQGTVDGRIGTKTRSAIKAFQSANNLVADGVAGAKTMSALGAYLAQDATT